ncbi:MAG: hypothetical protein SGILL_004793, partial [Bacillariaceae sp.]
GMMYEEQKGSVPVASVTPDRPVAYAAGAFQPDQGMMFEARTAGGTPSYYEAAPVPQAKPNPSVFSSDGGMMFAARTAPGEEKYYQPEPVPQSQPRPSVFSSDGGGMMFSARTVPKEEKYYQAEPVPQSQPRPSVFTTDGGGMMFSARTVRSEAPQPSRPVDPVKGAFTPESGGMMYAVRQRVPAQPTPDRPVEPLHGVFSNDQGMMYEARTKIPEQATPTRLVPFKEDAFANDQGMMYNEREDASPRLMLNPQVADEDETVGQSFAKFDIDGGMMLETQMKEKPVVKNPNPAQPGEPVVTSDSMAFSVKNSADGQLVKNPNPSEPLSEPQTISDSMAFRVENVVEAELVKNPNPSEPLAEPATLSDSMAFRVQNAAETQLVKNPNPSDLLDEPVKANDSMSFGFSSLEDGDKRLYLNPEVANSIEIHGPRAAAFATDGGIQLLTQTMEKPMSQNEMPTNGYQLVASDKQSFSLDKNGAADKPRYLIPPKIAKASETIGQHFAAFDSDGGIQMVTKMAPKTVSVNVVNPMDASFLHYEGEQATAGFGSDGLQYVQNSLGAGRKYLPQNIAEMVETTGQSFAAFESDGGIQKIAKSDSTLFWVQ